MPLSQAVQTRDLLSPIPVLNLETPHLDPEKDQLLDK